MKLIIFEHEIIIKKFFILKKELDILIKELDKNQKIFDEICDNIDGNITRQYIEEASAKLSIILDRSDNIYQRLFILNKIFSELKSKLMN